MNVEITYHPKCGKITLTRDDNMTPTVKREGTIELETAIADLDEVKALTPYDTVFDVGAFVGDTALTFAHRAGRVIGFEPQVDAWICARWNTQHISRVEIINAAVGNGEKVQVQENSLEGNLGTRSLSTGEGNETLRLDDFSTERGVAPTFLKIDCEGFEPYVLRGAVDLLKRCRPMVLVEVYGTMLSRLGFTPDDVIRPLVDLGYFYRVAIGREEDDRYDLLFRV
jgi:FkbM family methyltransferase